MRLSSYQTKQFNARKITTFQIFIEKALIHVKDD
jgi:hypothetical protein